MEIEKQYGKATTTRLRQVQTQLKQERKVESKTQEVKNNMRKKIHQ